MTPVIRNWSVVHHVEARLFVHARRATAKSQNYTRHPEYIGQGAANLHMHTCMRIYPPPRFARRVWPGSKLSFPTVALRLSLTAYIWAPLIRTAESPWIPPPPVGRLRKSWILLHVHASTHYFALWIHHTIHTTPICCSTSNVLFTLSCSCVPSKTLQNAKAKQLKNDWDYHQIWLTWASQFTSRNHVSGIIFHWNLKMQYWMCSKNQ